MYSVKGNITLSIHEDGQTRVHIFDDILEVFRVLMGLELGGHGTNDRIEKLEKIKHWAKIGIRDDKHLIAVDELMMKEDYGP